MENFLADLSFAQLQQGYEVAVLVHDHQRHWHRAFQAEPQALLPLYRVPCYGRLFYAPMSPHFPFWLHRVLKEFQPDILHLHLPNTSVFWVLFSVLARQIPWIIHWHADVDITPNPYLTAIYRTVYRPFEQQLLKRAQAIIATSEPYLTASTALYPWREKCQVVPLGIARQRVCQPTDSLRNWAEQQWQTGVVKILSVGRLTYYKGYSKLIYAMSQIHGAQLCIVGQGELQKSLASLVLRLNLSHKVKLLGYRSDAEVQALFATSDCFCLSSIDRAEAFGVVLIEAMGYAKPVIVSAIPGSGVNWVVDNGHAGLLVSSQDICALANALQLLVDQPVLRQQFAERGQQRFQQLFNIQKVAERLTTIYSSPVH